MSFQVRLVRQRTQIGERLADHGKLAGLLCRSGSGLLEPFCMSLIVEVRAEGVAP